MSSPLSRTALAVSSVKTQAKRRMRRWRERLQRVILSRIFQESAIVQRMVRMFGMSADGMGVRRASSRAQFAGSGYRQLRMENLEGRQMLSVNVPSTPDLDPASDTGPSTTDNNTNDNTPTFNGTSDANSLVRVGAWVDANIDTIIDDSEVSNIAEVSADGSGNYSATLDTLADGSYQIVAKAYDELGNPSEGSNNGWSDPLSIVIDTTIAATTIDLATASDSVSPNTDLPGTDTDDLTNINTPVFQGTAEPGATIEVFDGTDPTPIATATANGTGDWVTSPLAVALTDDVHSITAVATDEFGNMSTSDPLLVTIDTVVSTNTAPVMTAASDTGSSSSDNITNVDTPTFTGMTEDDAPSNAYVELLLDGTTVIATGNASSGVWTLTTAAAIADGTYTVEARVTDHTGNVSTSGPTTIVIDTVDPNAVDDDAATDEDTPVTHNVIVNDTDAIDPELTVTGVTDGANGTVLNNDDGTVTYTPNADFNGTDTFTYTVTDDAGNSATATVNITVNAVNDPPIAVDDTAVTDEDTPVTTEDVLANDTDVDDPLTPASITEFTQGANGTVASNGDGTFTYTPDLNFNGTDSFTYTISDGLSSATATVNITVNPVNDPPTAMDDTDATDEDTPVTVTVLANDNGGPANEVQTVTVTATTDGTNGTVTTDGTTVTYTPNADFNGTDSFTYTITDDGGLTATATVNITVNAVNDPPIAVDDTAVTDEDTPVTTEDVLANDTDVDDPLTPASITEFTQGANGTVASNGDGTFTYTPDLNFNGTDSFTYTISDGLSSATATVNITVNPVNDPPTAMDDTDVTDEDTPVTVTVLANDNGGPANEVQTVTVTATTDGANGTVTTDGTTVTYTPNADFNGTDSFTYTITDDGGLTATATVNITVNPVNDPPIAMDDTAVTDEDTPVTTEDVLANDTDVDDPLTPASITEFTQGANGTVASNGDGTFTYTPDLNFNGTDSFTYTISDGLSSDTATVNITVNPSVVVTGPSSANDGQTLTYTFTTNDPGAGSPYTRTITSSNPLDVVTPLSFDSNTGSGTFKVTFHGPIGTSTSILTVDVSEEGGALVGSNTRTVTVTNTFRVTGIVVNDSGFDFTFNNAIDFTNLNLYDGINPLLPGDTFKLPDVVVHGAISNIDIKGSVVWNAATNTLSWVKSGGVFGADTYFIKLVSGADAFKDTSGNLLDGNGDFVAGGNYQQSVPISILGGTPIISLPDFARGPGQVVDLTASNTLDTTLPVRATGVNVQGVDFKLVYDTTLLTINPDQVTAVLPNWSVLANQTVVGTMATLIVSAWANLGSAAFSGTTAFVNISSTVPTSAPYGATQMLRLIDCLVDENNPLTDIAIQKVAFPGDANGKGILPSSSPPNAYTAEDAALIARVIVGAQGTTGFDAHPLVDPAIVGDASGNGAANLSAFDTSLIAQEAAGINTPDVPDETAAGTGGSALYDPQLSIPDNIPVLTGGTYELPVNITIDPNVVGIISSTYTVKYQTHDLDFLGASNGSNFPAPGWTMTTSEQVPGTIRVSIFSTFASGNNGGAPLQLGKLNFVVQSAANLGVSPLQIDPVDPTENGLLWTKDDGSVLISRLLGDYNLDNSVDAGDYVIWRKSSSTGGNGSANEPGYMTWRENYGTSFPGAGTGATVAGASTIDSEPVTLSNSTEVSPAAARDEALAGFALVSRSADSRTTRIARNRVQGKSQLGDRNLLYAVANEKRKYGADESDSLHDDNSLDHADAVDELLSDLDCELIKLL